MPLQFANRFIHQLPGDPAEPISNWTSQEIARARQPRQVHGACYSHAWPVAPSAPRLLSVASEVSSLIGLTPEETQSEWFLDAFSGKKLLPQMQPFAMCYGGHQFGHWAGQLGDGRAINLGEVLSPAGERWMLQLKGAGPTTYSRTADGFAVLRSSIREFLCSEAMFHLGVPTTRALCLIGTGDRVVRDMFYDGRPRREPGAIVCRVAPTFVRFGNFEIFAARNDIENLKRLIDYVIRTDFPELLVGGKENEERVNQATVVAWFHEVCRRTALMIVEWMRVGFVHGVMNTDNMSILGLTIDYGPYGWLEDYDPTWTPNTTDAEGRRYCYGQQPQIAYWNLAQLANALHACLEDTAALESGLKLYVDTMRSNWQESMTQKLGLETWQEDDDSPLVEGLFSVLRSTEIDMTWFYRLLGDWERERIWSDGCSEGDRKNFAMLHFRPAFYRDEEQNQHVATELTVWLERYSQRIDRQLISFPERRLKMAKVNPKYVLRNYLAQRAIEAAEGGDSSEIDRLLEVMRHPYDEQPGNEAYAEKRPEWARDKPGCSTLSCSS